MRLGQCNRVTQSRKNLYQLILDLLLFTIRLGVIDSLSMTALCRLFESSLIFHFVGNSPCEVYSYVLVNILTVCVLLLNDSVIA